MAEVNAAREARRRRILENSEGRLLKITSGNVIQEPKLVRSGENNSILCNNSLVPPSNQQEVKSELVTENSSELDVGRNHVSTPVSHSHRDACPPYTNSNETPISQSPSEDDSEWNVSRRKTHKAAGNEQIGVDSGARVLLSRRTNYILLAAVVNALLVFRLDNIFGKTITVPYFTMALGRLCICQDIEDTQGSSLLVAALILCNIKPEFTYKFKSIATMITLILGDLALYIFSFTLMYCAISCYLWEGDNPATSEK